MVSALGCLRRYKGLDLACEAVGRLEGKVQLVIGGLPHPEIDLAALRRAVGPTLRFALLDRWLTDQEFADIVAASEAILLPYRQITGSGALLAAWTLGCGVIASDLPFFAEMLGPEPDAGRLFPAGDAAGLAQAIAAYLAIPAPRRAEAALGMARRHAWDRCVEPVVGVLRDWMAAADGPRSP